jgi:hypothetical protein
LKSVKSPQSIEEIEDILVSTREKGVTLWSENGQLHYKAPKGVLTHEEIDRIRISRNQIVTLLQRSAHSEPAEPRLEPHSRLDRAPLAFQQLAHWRRYQLNERRAIRQIASALRLRGRLNVNALQESIAEIVRRHDALRTRIVFTDEGPIQEISQAGNCKLELDDLTELPEGLREAEVSRSIEKQILDPIDVSSDPLFAVRLLKLYDDEYVLIVAMEHMISDAFSLNILLRELSDAYTQKLKGRASSLPVIPVQFSEYAVCQSNSLKSWLQKHGAYWSERLIACQRVGFPYDKSSPTKTRVGWGIVPVRIGIDLKAELREWSRLRRTTLVMSVFTAYVGLVMRWCNASECTIQYQSDGRVSPETQNTIGYFASLLYLRVVLLENDSLVDLMNRVTEEYCTAYEHSDFSYFAAQNPRPGISRSSSFNWVPQGPKIDRFGSEDEIACSPINFVRPMTRNMELDGEPSILLFDTDGDETVGEVGFPLSRFSVDTMERFGRNFLVFVRALLRQPAGLVKDVLLCK